MPDGKDLAVIDTEPEPKEIARRETGDVVPAMRGATLAEIEAEVEKQVRALGFLRRAALSATNHEDWVAMRAAAGSVGYYLEATGAEKIAQFYGVEWDAPTITREDDNGFPSFLVSGRLTSKTLGKTIFHEGGRSGRDPFFANQRDGASVIDIRKAALSNWLGTGVARIAGLRGVTPEELAEAGVKVDRIAGFGFKEKTANGQPAPKADDPGDDEKRAKVRAWILEMAGGDSDEAKAHLAALTSFQGKDGTTVPGVGSVAQLKDKRLAVTYGKVRDKYETWKSATDEPGANG
jgi:hypothetical protein